MKNNSKYFKKMIIPIYICIIYVIISVLAHDFSKIDITGVGKKFLYIQILIIIVLFSLCIRNAIVVQREGKNVKFNSIMAISFCVLAIMSFTMGIYLRTSEEKMAKDFLDNQKYKTSEDIINYLKTNPKDVADTIIKESTMESERIKVILNEIDNEPNIVIRFLKVFFTGENIRTSARIIMGREIYYAAYPIIIAISIYMFTFFYIDRLPIDKPNKWL